MEFRPQTLPPLDWEKSPNFYDNINRPDKVKKIRLIVPHTAEGFYEGTISHFKNKSAEASSHIVLDQHGENATQMVGYADRAWTQQAFNPVTISIECAGFISPNLLRGRFGHSIRQMRKTARIVAFFLHKYDLPNHWVRNSERFTGKGYTRHGDLMPEGGHPLCLIWKGARWRAFRFLVTREYKRGKFRPKWGRE